MGDGEGGGIEMKHVKRQGVSYSQNSAVNTVFPIYITQIVREYQNVKLVKSKCKSEKSKKSKQQNVIV